MPGRHRGTPRARQYAWSDFGSLAQCFGRGGLRLLEDFFLVAI